MFVLIVSPSALICKPIEYINCRASIEPAMSGAAPIGTKNEVVEAKDDKVSVNGRQPKGWKVYLKTGLLAPASFAAAV